MKPSEFGKALKQGPYAWPGGYPTYFVMIDGAAICFDCAKECGRHITEALREQRRDDWKTVGVEVNWEDPSLYCDHCGNRIESAYAEDEHKAISAGRRQL